MRVFPKAIRRHIAGRPNLARVIENIGWLSLDKVIRMSVGVVVGLWLARYLGPAEYGLLNFALALTGLFGAVATLGLQGVVVRELVQSPVQREETLGTAALMQIIGSFVAFGLLATSLTWLRADDPGGKLIIITLGTIILFRVGEIAAYWFESQVQSKYTVWVQNFTLFSFALLKALLILKNAQLDTFAMVMALEAAFAATFLLLAMNKFGPKFNRLRVNFYKIPKLLHDGWPLMLSSLAIVFYMKTDQVMLGHLLGDQAVGIYSAALKLSEVWYFIPMMITASIFPSILQTKARNVEQYYARLQKLFDLMVWLSLIISLPLAILSNQIVSFLYGSSYSSAADVLLIHAWTTVPVFLSVATSQWYLAENRQIFLFQSTLVGATMNVTLNFLLIPAYGPSGAAVATLVSYLSVSLFSDLLRRETRPLLFMKLSSFNLFASGFRLTNLKDRISRGEPS